MTQLFLSYSSFGMPNHIYQISFAVHQGNMKYWLQDPDCNDQYSVIFDGGEKNVNFPEHVNRSRSSRREEGKENLVRFWEQYVFCFARRKIKPHIVVGKMSFIEKGCYKKLTFC